ncbi:MAG: hypothetical protein R6X14_08735 [bacterium]
MADRKRSGRKPRRRPGLDRRLYDALTENYARGAIVILGTRDKAGRAVRAGQRLLTRDDKPSRWSHCFLFGDRRLTCSGPGRPNPRLGLYILESDLQLAFEQARLQNGAQENWLGKWCRPDVEHCAVIDYRLSRREVDIVLANALHLVDRQVSYPLQDLVGTWLAIVRNRLWSANPLKSRNAMYCSAFVRYCYRKAGRDFMRHNVSLGNTAPEHIARAAEEQGRLRIIR